jgi:DNA helicase-2/ATP-dependent DNA helicase PcrA
MAEQLNDAQRAAVTTLSGPLLILAGAGTGKTRVITVRIASLIRHGVAPDRILALTFTNKAAREMRERAGKLLAGRTDDRQPFITTFHALCAEILRREIRLLGYPRDFTILDRGDQESIIRTALRECRIGPDELEPRQFTWIVSKWKTMGLMPDEVKLAELDERERIAWKAYRPYQQALKNAGSVDFDDLLLLVERLFRNHEEALVRQRSRWQQLLVDEYQDTSLNQYRILQRLVAEHRNLCVVGDDDQSIYGWRGADIRNILSFQKDFPETRVVRLEENYRCCPNILDLANRLIRKNSQRHEKTLRSTRQPQDRPLFCRYPDEVAEARGTAADIRKIQAAEKRAWSDFAILFRTNEQPRPFEQELRAMGIPYVLVGGASFFDRREVKDLIAWLKVLVNPADEVALLRAVRVPSRGIGEGVFDRLVQRGVEAGKSVWEILPGAVADGTLGSRPTAGLGDFVQQIERTRAEISRFGPVEAVRGLIERINLKGEIARRSEDDAERAARWDAVGEVLNMMARFMERRRGDLKEFLDELLLEDRDKEPKDERKKDAVTLITLHSAKGLEFPVVYLVGMEEGLLPHERSLSSAGGVEEERRLAYVGVTRAKDRLTLSRTTARTRFGRKSPAHPSRFLKEMFGDTLAAGLAEGNERIAGQEGSSVEGSADGAIRPGGISPGLRRPGPPPVTGSNVAAGSVPNAHRGFKRHGIRKSDE